MSRSLAVDPRNEKPICLVAVCGLLQADSDIHAEPARRSILDFFHDLNLTQSPYPYFPPRPNYFPSRPPIRGSEFATFQAEGSSIDPDSQESQESQDAVQFQDNYDLENGDNIVLEKETVAFEDLKTNVGVASEVVKTEPADVKTEENVTKADANTSEKSIQDTAEEPHHTVAESNSNTSTTASTVNVDKEITSNGKKADLEDSAIVFPVSSETNDEAEVVKPDGITEKHETVRISNSTKDNSTNPDLSSRFSLDEAEYRLVPVATINTPVITIDNSGNRENSAEIFVNSPQKSPGINPQLQTNNQQMPIERYSARPITTNPNRNVIGEQILNNVQAFSSQNNANQVQLIPVNGVFDSKSVQLLLNQNNQLVNNLLSNVPQTFSQSGQVSVPGGNVQNQSSQIFTVSELNNNQGVSTPILLSGGNITPNNNQAYNILPQTFNQNNPGLMNGVNLVPNYNLGSNAVTTNAQPGTKMIPNYSAGNIVPQIQQNFDPSNNKQLYTIVNVPNYPQNQNGVVNNGNFHNQQMQPHLNTNTYTLVPLRNDPNYGTNGRNNQVAVNNNGVGIPSNQFNTVSSVQVPLNTLSTHVS